jgi:hypothetical protein
MWTSSQKSVDYKVTRLNLRTALREQDWINTTTERYYSQRKGRRMNPTTVAQKAKRTKTKVCV